MKRVECSCGTKFKASSRRALPLQGKRDNRKYQPCPACETLVDVTEAVKR